MIEDSIHDGKYPLEDQHKRFSNSLQVINRSDFDDLKGSEIKIEVRIQGLYIISNYVTNIEHLPGIIEVDVLDFFKILCSTRSEEHTSELQSLRHLVCRLLLE